MPGTGVFDIKKRRRRKFTEAKMLRRKLRDSSNPMSIPEPEFIKLYRLNKAAYSMILNEIEPFTDNSSIPQTLQLAATLRFLASGGFQGVVASDANISMGRSTLSKVLWRVMDILENQICSTWINLPLNEEEIKSSKLYFLEKFGIPGVIGCLAGTHVRIIRPSFDECLFYNQKGHFSINVMIICDHEMRIRAVDGCRPGSCHDDFIWSMSDARAYYQDKQENGEQNGWLLGNSVYDLETFLMTPYRNPQHNSNEHIFNKKHKAAMNIMESTIQTLKFRFQCLKTEMLKYVPAKVVKIVNVCCALHNICMHFNIEMDITNASISDNEDEGDESGEVSHQDEEEYDEINYNTEALTIRDNIANSLENVKINFEKTL